MVTLKEEATNYTPPIIANITTLSKIPINIELSEAEATNKEGEKYKYKYITFAGVKYRMPGPVIGGIKAVLAKYPDTKYITVDKEGEGLQTKYHVMPHIPKK